MSAVSSSPLAPPTGSVKLTGTIIGVAGSYQNLGNTIANVFDGSTSTFFDAPAGVVGWAGLNLGSPELVTQVQYVPRTGYTGRMVGGVFQGSNMPDFSSGVINLFSVAANPLANTYTAQTVNDTVAVQYVRYLAPANASGNVAELEFDGVSSVVVPPLAAPDAPTIASATAVSSSDVHLNFGEDAASTAVTTYTIERQGPTDATYMAIGTTNGISLAFDDTTAAASTTYSYVVLATNTGGSSAMSAAATVSVPAAPVVPVTPVAPVPPVIPPVTPTPPVVPPVVPTPPVVPPVVPPTTGSKLTGAVIGTAGSYGNSGNTITNVFDTNPGTYFDASKASGAWVGLNLGTAQLITQIQYVPRSGWASRMVGGVFQASNVPDFSSGVITLFTVTTAPTTGVFTAQAVTDTVGVQYVRYVGPSNGYCNVAEIEFDGNPLVLPSVPDAPTIGSSTAASPTDVHLNFSEDSASSVVTTYTIERQGPTNANYLAIGTAAGTAVSFDDTTASPSTTYSYIVVASNAGGASIPSNAVSVTLPPPPLNPWTDTDIGAPALAGSATLNLDGTINVNGSGADIWNQTDAFNFDYQPMVGNGTIVTQVTAESNTNSWAKSGIMIRETTDADSRFVDLTLTPGNGVSMQSRTATHTSPSFSLGTSGKLGVWLELVRTGSSFSGYVSTDDINWTLVGTVNISMVNNVDAGLCVTAHDNTKLCAAKFSNVAIIPAGSQASVWTAGATSPMDRWESESFTYNNQLYIFGGFIDRTLDATTECDTYNPATNTWSEVTTIPTGALTHAATAIVGDTVYFAGGNLGNFADYNTGTCTSAVISYDLTTGVWGSVASLPAAVSCGGMVCINNTLIYYGGLNSNSTVDLSTTWSLNLTNPNATWTTDAAMPNARNHVGYAAVNGIAYAIGGQHLYNETGGNVSEVDAYNPVTNAWTKVANLPTVLGSIHTSVMVVNGKIVVVGGQINGGYDGIYQTGIEEFDPVANSWASVGTLPEANEGESVAYINGELIVADGTVDNQGGWSLDQTWLDSQISL